MPSPSFTKITWFALICLGISISPTASHMWSDLLCVALKVLWIGEFHRIRTRPIEDACVIALREWNEISDLTG
jgi:hypothetical protein